MTHRPVGDWVVSFSVSLDEEDDDTKRKSTMERGRYSDTSSDGLPGCDALADVAAMVKPARH